MKPARAAHAALIHLSSPRPRPMAGRTPAGTSVGLGPRPQQSVERPVEIEYDSSMQARTRPPRDARLSTRLLLTSASLFPQVEALGNVILEWRRR